MMTASHAEENARKVKAVKQKPKMKITAKKLRRLIVNPTSSVIWWTIALIVVWELGATAVEGKNHPEYLLPHISQIIASIFSSDQVSNGMTATQVVLTSAGDTLVRAGIGFLIGMAGGFTLALLMHLWKAAEKLAFPYLMIIQMIPILGMAPIVLALTGDIGSSRIVIAAILTFYPVATNTLAGLKSAEREKYDLMAMCSASKPQIYFKTLIPCARPYFFTGLKISAPMAITASILVDTLQGDGGLGCMLSQSLKHGISIYVFWQIVLFSAFIGVASVYAMNLAEVLLTPQKRAKLLGSLSFKRREEL
jgi:ABC-type nitrate/sulfonate/bicarbonate transport system, permease component